MGELRCEGGIILAVCEEGDDSAERRSNEDVMPVVAVVHRAGDGYEGGGAEWS